MPLGLSYFSCFMFAVIGLVSIVQGAWIGLFFVLIGLFLAYSGGASIFLGWLKTKERFEERSWLASLVLVVVLISLFFISFSLLSVRVQSNKAMALVKERKEEEVREKELAESRAKKSWEEALRKEIAKQALANCDAERQMMMNVFQIVQDQARNGLRPDGREVEHYSKEYNRCVTSNARQISLSKGISPDWLEEGLR